MKARTFVSILILVLAVMVIAGSCATMKQAISIDDAMKEFAGVYVNTEYDGNRKTQPQKYVVTSDGKIEDWALATNERASWKGEYVIVESWVDSEGNIYCTVDTKYYTGSTTKELWKLDKTRSTFEEQFKLGRGGEYPTKIDPDVEPYGPLYYWTGQRQ